MTRKVDLADGFLRDADDKVYNFEGCPQCCGRSPVCEDCPRCGGFGVIPSLGNTGPGTFHVLSLKLICWCEPTATEGFVKHRDDATPPLAIQRFAEVNCAT